MKRSTAEIKERHNKILSLLKSDQDTSIDSLVSQLGVSSVTVRKDLEQLASSSQVVRVFGGARLAPAVSMVQETEPTTGSDTEIAQRAIAKRAAALIDENDIVLINSSITASYVVEYLESKTVTIVTNNTAILQRELSPNITLIVTGGQKMPGRTSLTGVYAINALSQIVANKCILGVRGISANNGITSQVLEESSINQKMIQKTNGLVIVTATSEKVGNVDSFFSGGIDSVNTLITDQTAMGAKDNELNQLREIGIDVYFA